MFLGIVGYGKRCRSLPFGVGGAHPIWRRFGRRPCTRAAARRYEAFDVVLNRAIDEICCHKYHTV